MWHAVNAEGFDGLFPELDRWIGHARALFPWLEFVTTSEAEERYRAHVDSGVSVTIAEDAVEIATDREGMFFVRTRAGAMLVPGDGGDVLDSRTVEGGSLHVVRCATGRTRFQIAG